MTNHHTPSDLPRIAMRAADHDRLSKLAEIGAGRFPAAAEFLAREVDRAEIVDDAAAQGLVRMGSRVKFRDETTGQVRQVTLVYPEAADTAQGKISVLTPIGAALVGLSVGQSIEWELPSGDLRSLSVLSVEDGDA